MEAADWATLSDQDLLERRISKLGLRLEGTALEPLIRQLYDELYGERAGAASALSHWRRMVRSGRHPGDFHSVFLVHDRLRALEKTMMLEVEGGTPEWFMKLMRHEAAHAYMYAYQLPRGKKMASNVSGRRRARKRRIFIGRARSAAVMSCILTTGMRRVIRTKISPKLCGLAYAGVRLAPDVMRAGRRCDKTRIR